MARTIVCAFFAASLVALSGCGVKREPRVLISPSFSSAQTNTSSASREPVAAAQER